VRGLDDRISTRTRYPAARALLAIAAPRKPLAPVTNIRARPLTFNSAIIEALTYERC
jgi:hypothetical protein